MLIILYFSFPLEIPKKEHKSSIFSNSKLFREILTILVENWKERIKERSKYYCEKKR